MIAGLALAQEDFSERLDFITLPVTLLWGTGDLIAPIRTAKALLSLLTDAQLVTLEGYGHSPMLEKPEEFDKLLLENLTPKQKLGNVRKNTKPLENSVRFSEESGRTLTGAYKSLEIEYCDDFKLVDLTAETIYIKESTVDIEDFLISGGRNALVAYDSNITMTAGTIEAEEAIVADRSELDLAGVQIHGKNAIVTVEDWATLVLSICRANLGDKKWYLQGVVELTPDSLPWPK